MLSLGYDEPVPFIRDFFRKRGFEASMEPTDVYGAGCLAVEPYPGVVVRSHGAEIALVIDLSERHYASGSAGNLVRAFSPIRNLHIIIDERDIHGILKDLCAADRQDVPLWPLGRFEAGDGPNDGLRAAWLSRYEFGD